MRSVVSTETWDLCSDSVYDLVCFDQIVNDSVRHRTGSILFSNHKRPQWKCFRAVCRSCYSLSIHIKNEAQYGLKEAKKQLSHD